MKLTKTIIVLFVSSILVLVAGAVTPTPKPSVSPKPSVTDKTSPSPKPSATSQSSPAVKSIPPGDLWTRPPAPSVKPTPDDLPSPSEIRIATTASTSANAGPPPKPILFMIGSEPYTTGGKNWIRYRYDVANKAEYPADMFAAAPALPPCGSNTNASRTWVDFFDSTGKRLYGFCALSKPDDLGKLWFAMEEGVIPPSYVYIELNDRQTNTKYKSNLADTTL